MIRRHFLGFTGLCVVSMSNHRLLGVLCKAASPPKSHSRLFQLMIELQLE
jgi:hypothetical protein